MNKVKIIIICVLAAFLVFMFLKIKSREEFQQKALLAVQIRKVLDHLMLDLLEARENTLAEAPADGQWHDRIDFIQAQDGPLQYAVKDGHLLRLNKGKAVWIADDISDIRIRHQKATPDILEVEIVAHKNVSLISYVKIRTRY